MFAFGVALYGALAVGAMITRGPERTGPPWSLQKLNRQLPL